MTEVNGIITPSPCPFCAEPTHLTVRGDYVSCDRCGAKGAKGINDGGPAAVDAWNKRVLYECPEPRCVLSRDHDSAHFTKGLVPF